MSTSSIQERPARSSIKDLSVIVSVAGTSFINSFFSGALTSSLPTIGQDLNFNAASLQWPVSLYALILGAFLLPAGRLADVYGHRLLFLIGTAAIFLLSLAVALSPNSSGFSAFCALLGLGAACNVPAGVGILGNFFEPGPLKNTAFASLGAGQPCGFLAGLVVGALLTKVGWRASFYVQAGLAAIFFLLGFLSIPSKYHVDPITIPLTEVSNTNSTTHATHTVFLDLASNRRVDWIGTILSVAGLVLLTFALSDASSSPRGWKTPYLPPLIPISLLLLVAFFWWESRLGKSLAEFYMPTVQDNLDAPTSDDIVAAAANNGDASSTNGTVKSQANEKNRGRPPPPPLISSALWRTPHLSSLLAIVFLSWAGFNTVTFYINLLLQLVLDVTPIKTALYFLPMIISGFALNLVPGFAMHKIDGKLFIVSAVLLSLVSPILVATINIDASYWAFLFPIMLTAPACDLIFGPATVQISRSVPRSEQATAGALFNVTTRLATSISLAIISSISAVISDNYLEANPIGSNGLPNTSESPAVLLPGYRVAAWMCAGCVGVALVLSVVTLRGMGVVGKKEQKDD